ncbi:RNA polymerase sigma factor [Pedobacter hartonius]|uniref:RNA polymerase sigma-70 factor, ECF subfamily n=1 Tax=Pedobacter hartonius TaxID=425514 RepID=A0A1H4BFZ1_9SPHI|nr:sigma-70 family RNA polymerase sigma factor [Pedobacter hartonius]SEA46722.1 RNA polymerase sigma-70 factor, ECF subfamily [Pedobacter hartonius]
MILAEFEPIHVTNSFCDDPDCHHCLDAKFVRDLQERNQVSFRQLYSLYASPLLGIIMRVVPEREIAEDILQDSFVKIWKSINTFDPKKGKLFTWIAKLARNSAIDYKRGKTFSKSTRNEDIDSVFCQVDNFHYVPDKTDSIGVKELMCVLTASQKQILDLVYFHGYTQAEVSDELQIPLGTVKSKIRLAVKELRNYFM